MTIMNEAYGLMISVGLQAGRKPPPPLGKGGGPCQIPPCIYYGVRAINIVTNAIITFLLQSAN